MKKLILFFLIAFIPCIAFAETIVLKSGRIVEGDVVQKTDKYIKIGLDGLKITYYMDEIKSIDGVKVEQLLELRTQAETSYASKIPVLVMDEFSQEKSSADKIQKENISILKLKSFEDSNLIKKSLPEAQLKNSVKPFGSFSRKKNEIVDKYNKNLKIKDILLSNFMSDIKEKREEILRKETPAYFGIIGLMFGVLILWSTWIVFNKAGYSGWTCIIPIYNLYVLLKIGGRSGWLLLLLLVPIVNFFVTIAMHIGVARNFGKGAGFGLGLMFLPFIFFPVLAFGKSRYQPMY